MANISYSFETSKLQLDRIYDYLSNSYWSPNIRRDVVETAIEHSLCIGAYDTETGLQIGFARLVTDFGRFAYLCDVYVLDDYQGQGIGRSMCQALMDHENVKTVGHWVLATKDAHGVYAKLGFETAGDRYMRFGRSSDRWQVPEPNS